MNRYVALLCVSLILIYVYSIVDVGTESKNNVSTVKYTEIGSIFPALPEDTYDESDPYLKEQYDKMKKNL